MQASYENENAHLLEKFTNIVDDDVVDSNPSKVDFIHFSEKVAVIGLNSTRET